MIWNGELLIQMTSYFEFLVDKGENIQTHDLSAIPSSFITQLGNLKDSMIVSGVYQVMDVQMAAVTESKERIWIVSPEPYRQIGSVLDEKIASGIDVRIILEEKGTGTHTHTHIAGLHGKYFRTLPTVPILVGVFDDRAGVCFPDRSGKVDLSEMINGVSEEFYSWTSEVFEHYWKMSE